MKSFKITYNDKSARVYISTSDNTYFIILDGEKNDVYNSDNNLEVRVIDCKEQSGYFKRSPAKHLLKLNLSDSDIEYSDIEVKIVKEKGSGYDGGHNSYWLSDGEDTTYKPKPMKEAVHWIDTTTEGRFSGYYPEITNFIPINQ